MGCGCTRTAFPVTTTKITVAVPQTESKSVPESRIGKASTENSVVRQKSYNVIVKKDEILVRFDRKGEVMDYYARDSLRPGRLEEMRESYKDEKKSEAKAMWPAPSRGRQLKTALPDLRLQLDYVYGYQCYAARQNLFFLSPNEIVYPCASMAVILNTETNTQKFVGGGELSGAQGHTDDITALAVSIKKDFIATGEVGVNPLICVWKVSNLDSPLYELDQGAGSRGVGILSFSSNNKLLAAVDISSDQYIRIFDLKQRQIVFLEKGYPGHIYSLMFNPKENGFCSVGISHLFFWTKQVNGFTREKATYGSLGPECSMSTIQYLSPTSCLTGGHNGKLYLWDSTRLSKVQQVLTGSQEIYALGVSPDVVVTGGQDSKLHILDWGLKKLRVVEFSDWLKAVDITGNMIVCATRNGVITEVSTSGKKVLLETHSEGEVWSLSVDPQHAHLIISTGDDNKIKVWDTHQRRCVTTCTIEAMPVQNAAHRSSLLPSSQQSRAVTVGPMGHVAVGHNDGHVSIRRSTELESILYTLTPTQAWIRSLKYSPTGDKLAVGSSDGLVAVYDSQNEYEELSTFEGTRFSVTALDWSTDGTKLRACLQSGDLRFFDIPNHSFVEDGPTVLRDEEWAGWTAHRGWAVQGLGEVQGEEVFLTCVARAAQKEVVAVGNSWGLVDLYTYPAGPKAACWSYKAHSLEVTNLLWVADDSLLLTTGGHDLALMQWRVIG